MSGPNQSFTIPDRSFGVFPQPSPLGFKPRVVMMMGGSLANADIGTTFYTYAWGGFGWACAKMPSGCRGCPSARVNSAFAAVCCWI